jgi:hypothetical protein
MSLRGFSCLAVTHGEVYRPAMTGLLFHIRLTMTDRDVLYFSPWYFTMFGVIDLGRKKTTTIADSRMFIVFHPIFLQKK